MLQLIFSIHLVHMKKINYYQTENICWYFLFTFSLSGCWEEKLETLKQRRICCYSFCGTQSCCYNFLEVIMLLLYTLHLPFHVVFVHFQSIFRFAPEIILCRLYILPYRLSITDYRLLIYYYRFRILLYPLQTIVAHPCLPSYNRIPSIVFLQIPLRNTILSELFFDTGYWYYSSIS